MNAHIYSVLNSRWAIPTATGVVGVVAGGVVGYFVAKRKLNGEIEETLDSFEQFRHEQLQLDFERAEKDNALNAQIAEATRVAAEMKKEAQRWLKEVRGGDISVDDTPLQEVAKYAEFDMAQTEEQSRMLPGEADHDSEPIPVDPPIDNVFNDGWDYEAERNKRRGNEPYIIHVDEFVTCEMGYEQETVTWYEGDEVMVDQREVPIYNWRDQVGEFKWGHGSQDDNLCYTRNEKLRMEFEILRDPGSYEGEVLAKSISAHFERDDIRHMQAPRKFRDD